MAARLHARASLVRASLVRASLIRASLVALCAAGTLAAVADGASAQRVKPKALDNVLLPGVSFKARYSTEYRYEQDYDLDSSVDDLIQLVEPEASVRMSFMPDETKQFVVELEGSKVFRFDRPIGVSDPDPSLELKLAYLHLYNPDAKTALVIGRQEFKDDLEWLFDSELDGARLLMERGDFLLDVSLTREELFRKELLDDDRETPIDNYFLRLSYNYSKDTHHDAYIFRRDEKDKTRNGEDLNFFGIQSIGEITDDIKYWINAAVVTGTRERTSNVDIEGYGFDGIVTYVHRSPWEPSFTLGYAYGSGDSSSSDGKDGNFRQSDLQDNNARFNGITRFKYYGEVFDPELSNMHIFTLGIGLRPRDDFSIDLVYHAYRQVELDDDIRNSDLEVDPNELSDISRDLGQELDLIIGWRPRDGISVEVIGGVFMPGSAFGPGADNAYLGSLEITFNF